MTNIYGILEALFPFDWIQYDFMKNAFLGILFLCPLFALLGTMAVNNKMAFFSDALGHSAFTGIAIGVVLGVRNPLISMLAFGIFLSLAITKVKSSDLMSADTVISVFSSTAMAVGLVILSRNGGFSKYSSYLIGDILTVQGIDIVLILVVLVVAYILWVRCYNALLLVSVNDSLAASRGVKVALVENIFVLMVAVAVMLSIRWIGILTINSLLILPAAAGRNIAANTRQYHWITSGISLFSGICGLLTSYYMETSAGATMVLFAAGIFFLTYLMRKRVK